MALIALKRARKPRPEAQGELNPNAKISELDARTIKHLGDVGVSYQEIAWTYDISPSQAARIHKGEQWKSK
jgi:hypothetical protein